MTQVKIKLADGAVMPRRATEGASGYDLVALEGSVLFDGDSARFDTGVSLEMPRGWEAQVRPRSGMSMCGLIVPVGTIDQDYRGAIKVVIVNCSGRTEVINKGDRIAQLVFARVEHPTLEQVDELSATVRGDGGFGSSGR